MNSNLQHHFIGLDHLRALAAFMVFTWHFMMGNLFSGVWETVPIPIYPLSILTQGHTGVALFMALSGYLFAKILDNKSIRYLPFIWTRVVRLFPLLILVVIVVGYQHYSAGKNMALYKHFILYGLVKPTLPHGGWSITAELHFYIMLPFVLLLDKRWRNALFCLLLLSLIFKLIIYLEGGDIRKFSYYTIVGRFDQFICGILAFKLRGMLLERWREVAMLIVTFLAFYSYFDSIGGIDRSPQSIWIYLPLIEGVTYGVFISWYDNYMQSSQGKTSLFVAHIGKCSYSIYLLHFFFVWHLFDFFDEYIVSLSNIYVVLVFSLIGFLLVLPIAHLSYKFIELPFFRFKVDYIKRVE